MARTLFLVAYDIGNASRLRRVGRYFKSYRVDGQKSVPEIWITAAELVQIQRDLDHMIVPTEDRIQLLSLDPRMTVRCMGQAKTFGADFFCIA